MARQSRKQTQKPTGVVVEFDEGDIQAWRGLEDAALRAAGSQAFDAAARLRSKIGPAVHAYRQTHGLDQQPPGGETED